MKRWYRFDDPLEEGVELGNGDVDHALVLQLEGLHTLVDPAEVGLQAKCKIDKYDILSEITYLELKRLLLCCVHHLPHGVLLAD